MSRIPVAIMVEFELIHMVQLLPMSFGPEALPPPHELAAMHEKAS